MQNAADVGSVPTSCLANTDHELPCVQALAETAQLLCKHQWSPPRLEGPCVYVGGGGERVEGNSPSASTNGRVRFLQSSA